MQQLLLLPAAIREPTAAPPSATGYRATGAANITGAATGTARATWNIGRAAAAAAAAAALASAGPKTESGLH